MKNKGKGRIDRNGGCDEGKDGGEEDGEDEGLRDARRERGN